MQDYDEAFFLFCFYILFSQLDAYLVYALATVVLNKCRRV